MKNLTLFLAFLMTTSFSAKSQPLETVSQVDLNRYIGRWFDIASYPARFQRGCRCTTADYELDPGGRFVIITNRCIKFRGNHSKISEAKAKAFPVKGSSNSKLKVQFFWPFKGDYYIIGLADDYNWAIVGEPKRKYLWILSRDSFIPTDTYNMILDIVRKKGYDPNRLVKTPHNCDDQK